MSGRAPTRALYLPSGRDSIFALYDQPGGGAVAEAPASVLLCPMFGNDELCAYRALREWARNLAGAGHAVLRFDLPGTGDSSGGPRDPELVRAWIGAVGDTAAWLRAEQPDRRVAAIGIGLGGMLAWCAAADGAEIDDLALWGVPSRGRALVRQMRALSRMQASAGQESSDDDADEEGSLSVAGFFVSAQTAGELEQLDLSARELPGASGRRVLLLGRDGLEADDRLREAAGASAELTVANGEGYGAMVAPPQESQVPLDAIAKVGRWLGGALPAAPAGAAQQLHEAFGAGAPGAPPTGSPRARTAPHSASALELSWSGAGIRERPFDVEHAGATLRGVITEPHGPSEVAAVLLNAGAVRHVGPGRMWVEQARSWAARGALTLRIDLEAIGDSDGDFEQLRDSAGFYEERYLEQTLAALDALAATAGAERFVLGGLCSGAYWSLHAAVRDERVRAVHMVNPRAIIWDSQLQARRYTRLLLSAQSWRRFVRGDLKPPPPGELARSVATAARARLMRDARSEHDDLGAGELERAFDALQRRGVEVLEVFTFREPLLEELEGDGRLERMMARENVRIERLPGPLASHTFEPLALQRRLHAILDEAMERQLEQPAGGRPGAPGSARSPTRSGHG